MMAAPDIRRMSPEALARLGLDSLREHILAQAAVAHQRYAPLTAKSLGALLGDPGSVRYPVRVLYELGDMAAHQFVHPGPRPTRPGKESMVLFVHPSLLEHREAVPAAIAYAIPQINYGDPVTDEHCLLYGATLLGITADEYYTRLCAIADAVGATARYR
ncbi:MAG: hypothetical protein IT577_12015 [Verrucomicrobiae bacterium]|nr:hypothetical protein [Verrucomicrobiae bacterium]